MRSLLVLLFLFFESSVVFADLPLKENSSEWFWQGVYAFSVTLILLGLTVVTLWIVKNKVLPNPLLGRSQTEEAPFRIFSNQRIQVLSSKKLSVKTKVILISVDEVQYLILDNGQSVEVTLHQSLERKDEEIHPKTEALG